MEKVQKPGDSMYLTKESLRMRGLKEGAMGAIAA
jgi:hypothetical protein